MKWIYTPEFAHLANGAEVREFPSGDPNPRRLVQQKIDGSIYVELEKQKLVVRWAEVEAVPLLRKATENDIGQVGYVKLGTGWHELKLQAMVEGRIVVVRSREPEFADDAYVESEEVNQSKAA